MNILEFTMEHMHTNYPVPLQYNFIHYPEPNVETNGLLFLSEALDDIDMYIYNNRTLEHQAWTFVHEYHHLIQLARHGFDEQINNRWKYEVETELFTRDEFEVIKDKFSYAQREKP